MFLSFATSEAAWLNARPMEIAQHDDDDTLWFMSGLGSRKISEVEQCDRVLVTGQDDSRWIYLTGRATAVTDRGKIRELWKKSHEIWFPNGPDDPDVCLLRFDPQSAEYWDTSGARGIRYLFEAAKALVTGQPPNEVKGNHGALGAKG